MTASTFATRFEARITVPSGVSFTATNSGGGPTTITVPAGNYFPSALVTEMASLLNTDRTPANWTVSLSTGNAGTGLVSINWTGTGSYSIAWTSNGTILRNVLGFTGDLTGVTEGVASVGTKQMIGVWLPDCPLFLNGDRSQMPLQTDLRQSQTPTGNIYAVQGTSFYQHTGLLLSHVPERNIRSAVATYANAALEFWYSETQQGINTTGWFTPSSPVQIYDFDGTQVGGDGNGGAGPTNGWYLVSNGCLDDSTLRRTINMSSNIFWQVTFPRIVSSG